jgi:hypothetical protein
MEFCAHYSSPWLTAMLEPMVSAHTSGTIPWACEKTWKCKICGTEIAALLTTCRTKRELVIWRHVDPGRLSSTNCHQWRRVTSLEEAEYFPLEDRPLEVLDVYGPIMTTLAERLRIGYHFDRRVLPWPS